MKYTENNPPPVCTLIRNGCYHDNPKMTIKGVLWHDTAANNPYLKRYVQDRESNGTKKNSEIQAKLDNNPNNNDWNQWDPANDKNYVCVHAFVGKWADGAIGSVQTLPWDYRSNGVGGGCNGGWIQFEICIDNGTTESYFKEAFEEGCQLTAYLCKLYDLDPEGTATCKSVSNVPVILCHNDAAKLGLGSNHSDVYNWFNNFGKTMNDVRKRVKEILQESGDWSKPANQVDAALAASGQALVYTTYQVGVNLKTEEFVLPEIINNLASSQTNNKQINDDILSELYSNQNSRSSEGERKPYMISKIVPLVEKTSMELGGSGIKFFTEQLAPFESLTYLNDTNVKTKWNVLNNMQTTSLDFNEIMKIKSGEYSGRSIISNLISSNNTMSIPSGDNYLTFPMKYLNISCLPNGSSYHLKHINGTPIDYPYDICGKDSGRDWFYCPCNEVEITYISGVGNGYTNTIWLKSTSKVIGPFGQDYIAMQLTHSEDEDLKDFKVGQKFTRGQQICREGNDGVSFGNHIHFSIGTGENTTLGYTTNSAGGPILHTTGKPLKLDEAFYINPDFTTIINAAGLKFKNLPTSIK